MTLFSDTFLILIYSLNNLSHWIKLNGHKNYTKFLQMSFWKVTIHRAIERKRPAAILRALVWALSQQTNGRAAETTRECQLPWRLAPWEILYILRKVGRHWNFQCLIFMQPTTTIGSKNWTLTSPPLSTASCRCRDPDTELRPPAACPPRSCPPWTLSFSAVWLPTMAAASMCTTVVAMALPG
jgi:hypothetical protein